MNPVRRTTPIKLLHILIVVSMLLNMAPSAVWAAPVLARVQDSGETQEERRQSATLQQMALRWARDSQVREDSPAATETATPMERPALWAGTSYSHTLFLPLLAQNASPSAAVMLEKQVWPSLAMSGDVVTYTMVVSNTGSILLKNGVLVDRVPEQIEILEANGAEYDTGAGELRWDVGQLYPGQKVTVTLQAQVADGITTSVVENGSLTLTLAYLKYNNT